MKVTSLRAEMLDFGTQIGMTITLENGKRLAVRMYLLDLDSEELPELLLAIGKEFRKEVREMEK